MARKISTQIQFDPDMYEAIKTMAESKGWSMAQIVRLALQEYLAKNKEEYAPGTDVLISEYRGNDYGEDDLD